MGKGSGVWKRLDKRQTLIFVYGCPPEVCKPKAWLFSLRAKSFAVLGVDSL